MAELTEILHRNRMSQGTLESLRDSAQKHNAGKETKGEITFQPKHLEGPDLHRCQFGAVTRADDNSSSAQDRWEIANFVLPDEDLQCKSSYNSYELWILLFFL